MKNDIEILTKAREILNKGLINELRAQGHYLTGALENSIKGTIKATSSETSLEGTMYTYGVILHHGVSPDNVPFGGTGGSGGGTSKYIEGLKTFFMLKGFNEKKALQLAFATAKKHKKEGMPTNASSVYSETGKRKDFIEETKKNINGELHGTISRGIDDMVNNKFHETKSETI